MHFQPTIHRGLRAAVLAIATLLLTAGLAASAQATAKDSNRDGLPDRWEKRHHLSLKVNQARRDQDHDGVVNKCEFQSHGNPRRKDSDRDGVRDGAEDHDHDGVDNRGESHSHSHCGDDDGDHDGVTDDDENAGKIVSFENGVLTITTVTGTTVSGTVNDLTKIECGDGDDDAVPPTSSQVSAAHDGASGEREDENEAEDDHNSAGQSGGDSGDRGRDDSHEDDHCTVAELLPGATVHEATLVDGVFTKIELIK